MSSKTRIIILRMKAIIYTLLFLFFVLILILMLVSMFFKNGTIKDNTSPSKPTYAAETYLASDNPLDF